MLFPLAAEGALEATLAATRRPRPEPSFVFSCSVFSEEKVLRNSQTAGRQLCAAACQGLLGHTQQARACGACGSAVTSLLASAGGAGNLFAEHAARMLRVNDAFFF